MSSKYRVLAHFLVAIMLIGFVLLNAVPDPIFIAPAQALNDGQARRPPMGWNSWNYYGCTIDEHIIREAADALVASGMRDAGYTYVVIDDCWQGGRGSDGQMHAHTHTFPSGIPALAAYVHERGLKLGIYTDAGSYTCQGKPGSLGYEYQDAALYAAWGVDFVKIDWCFSDGLEPRTQYALWRDAIAASGRPMLLSISEWGTNAPWDWAADVGHMWRTTQDIRPEWASILRNLDETAWRSWSAGPGRWHDPDMLEVGNPPLTLDEQRAHFSMWALLAAPLMAGNDLLHMPPEVAAILTNHEVIAIDQDAAGIPGTIVDDTGTGQQVWMKNLGDGRKAVALLNRGEHLSNITAYWGKLGLATGAQVSVRDIWAASERGLASDAISADVGPHSVVLLLLSAPTAGLNESFLSDWEWIYAESGFGPVEHNRSNGEAAHGDGRMLLIAGRSYEKGIGVHAPAQISYMTAGRCAVFQAEVGIDDEVPAHGAVVFEVWADGVLAASSGPVRGGEAARQVWVDLRGIQELRLVVTDGGDWTDYDHADWGNARVSCTR